MGGYFDCKNKTFEMKNLCLFQLASMYGILLQTDGNACKTILVEFSNL